VREWRVPCVFKGEERVGELEERIVEAEECPGQLERGTDARRPHTTPLEKTRF
jgi:hypothetical protein